MSTKQWMQSTEGSGQIELDPQRLVYSFLSAWSATQFSIEFSYVFFLVMLNCRRRRVLCILQLVLLFVFVIFAKCDNSCIESCRKLCLSTIILLFLSRGCFSSATCYLCCLCRLQDHSKVRIRSVSFRRIDSHHGPQWRRQVISHEHSRWIQVMKDIIVI